MRGGSMGFGGWLTDYSKGDGLWLFWNIFRLRARSKSRFVRHVLTFYLNRAAHRHGGYIGSGAVLEDVPSLPHGLHGVYISRYAHIGKNCRIYQNVTVGEVDHRAPVIGDGCLIGAGAVLIGGICIGKGAKIGAGAVVCRDVPAFATAAAEPARIYEREAGIDEREARINEREARINEREARINEREARG